MQNSFKKKVEQKRKDLAHFIKKIKVAYQFIISKKGFVSVNNTLFSFNMKEDEIGRYTAQITTQMAFRVAIDKIKAEEDARIDKAVHDLVYSN